MKRYLLITENSDLFTDVEPQEEDFTNFTCLQAAYDLVQEKVTHDGCFWLDVEVLD